MDEYISLKIKKLKDAITDYRNLTLFLMIAGNVLLTVAFVCSLPALVGPFVVFLLVFSVMLMTVGLVAKSKIMDLHMSLIESDIKSIKSDIKSIKSDIKSRKPIKSAIISGTYHDK